MPLKRIVVERPRSKFVKKEVIVPGSHTVVYLNKRGQEAMKKLTDAERRWLAVEGTQGGGYEGNSKLYFPHSTSVYRQWRKVQSLLNKAYKRKRKTSRKRK